MKKIYLIVIIIITFTSCSYAQVTTDPSTNNVGVGTPAPLDKLDISGSSGGSPGRIVFGDGNVYAPYMKFLKWTGSGANYLQTTIANSLDVNGGFSFQTGSGGAVIGSDVQTTRMVITQPGYVGIGTTTPTERLTIGDESGSGRNVLRLGYGTFSQPGPVNTASAGDKIILLDAVSANYDARIGVGSRANFWMKSLATNGAYGNFEWYSGTNTAEPNMTLSPNGSLCIGTMDSHGYRLAVNGNVIATSVTVKLYSNWPDYVFKPTYSLKPLSEVKTYIDKNHRLPEMPSEKEVADRGVDLGEMNKLLVKKIEELTLYLVEKDNQLKMLNDKLDKLDQKVGHLANPKRKK